MNKCKVLALPVDGRPVTREQVQLVARIAGCELLCPPVAALGHFREAADRDRLVQWVQDHADQVDGFIFSLDMLVYGGLVPSRFIDDELTQLESRLELLKRLKAAFPAKPLYGFCATMRMSNNNENEEEKLYWAEHGTDIWAWSFFTDRHQCLGDAGDLAAATEARGRIPDVIAADYLATRARNFAVTEAALALVADGIIDRLILPQDDTAEFGFNIAERRQLQAEVSQRKLDNRVLIYPGADEVIYTLLVHQLQQLGVLSPISFALLPHHAQALNAMIARYEDRPVMQSIRCQIDAAGAQLVDDETAADAWIAVHCRASEQGDWAMQYPLAQDLGIDAQWQARLSPDTGAGTRPLALLDLAFANGADPDLIESLTPDALQSLCAFSAWNTASNAIGSLVAQVCAWLGADSTTRAQRLPFNRQMLAIRLLDDYLYQSRARQQIRARQRQLQQADGHLPTLVSDYLPLARQWLSAQGFPDIALDDVYYPWSRTFEVGLQLQITQDAETLSGVPAQPAAASHQRGRA